MVIVGDTLTIELADCPQIELEMREGNKMEQILDQHMKTLNQGSYEALKGVEIPSEYWYLANELL